MLIYKVAFSLFFNINQAACSTIHWVLKSQLDFDWLTFLDASMGISDTGEDNSNVKMTTCYSVVFISDDTSVFIRTVFVGPARID